MASSVEPDPAGWVKMLTGSPIEINRYGAVDRQEEDLSELLLDQTQWGQ